MKISKRHRVLIATDGSPPAEAALATATRLPWAAGTQARALVVAYADWLRPDTDEARAAVSHNYQAVADTARRALSDRWKKSDAVIMDNFPVEGILDAARRFHASVVVLGWRGHGTFRRLLAGSVSRAVAAHAGCPVLVVRDAPRAVRRFVVGYDGCPNAQRAVDFLCSLDPPPAGRAVLVNVVQPLTMPKSASVLPSSTRAHVRQELNALNEERQRDAQRTVDAAVARLKRCGWSATGGVHTGAPLERLLSAVSEHRADILVVGARGVGGMERALLGSVANGALNRASVPVLLTR